MMFLHFLYRTALLSFLQSVAETFTFTLRGATVLPPSDSKKGGAFDNGTFFPHLPKCCRYEHNGKHFTSYDGSVVYNVRHTFTKN